MPKRAVVLNLVKAALTVWCLMPALSLLYVLNRMDRHFIRNFNYQVFALAIGETGAWAFIFLFITLACTPIQRLTGWRFAGELRRTLGLITFLYSFLHLVAYFVIGQKLRLDYTWADAMLRKSRLPGWGALLLLVPLAVTSTDGMIVRVGAKRWKNLHRLVYLAGALAIWHLAWTDADNQTDYHRTKNALVPFVILILLRFLPLSSWRQKLRTIVPTRSSPDR